VLDVGPEVARRPTDRSQVSYGKTTDEIAELWTESGQKNLAAIDNADYLIKEKRHGHPISQG
jgi:hypothetical protein